MLAVNRIFLQYKTKEISREETVARLLTEIFKSPKYYLWGAVDEDETSSFLVWIHPHIPRIIDNYHDTESSFLTYFTWTVRLRYKSWRRKHVGDSIFQRVLDNHQSWEYAADTRILEAGEPISTYSLMWQEEYPLEHPLSTKQALTILVLALRSIDSLSQKAVMRIPLLTGISHHEFQRCLDEVERGMTKKRARYNRMEQRINQAYISFRKCEYELSVLDKNLVIYTTVEHHYQYYKQLLKKLREAKRDYNMRPSYRLIEGVLRLQPGTVRRILNNADKQIAQIKELLDPKKK